MKFLSNKYPKNRNRGSLFVEFALVSYHFGCQTLVLNTLIVKAVLSRICKKSAIIRAFACRVCLNIENDIKNELLKIISIREVLRIKFSSVQKIKRHNCSLIGVRFLGQIIKKNGITSLSSSKGIVPI